MRHLVVEGDFIAYLIIGLFWSFCISANFAYFHIKGFSTIDAGSYAWGMFFIAHALYELPYMFYYQFFTSYHVNPIAVYLSLSGFAFMLWLLKNYPTSLEVFINRSLSAELIFSISILVYVVIFGGGIIIPDYGMSLPCWGGRVVAVIYTNRITYDLGRVDLKDEETIISKPKL